jgi:hypothetical protein
MALVRTARREFRSLAGTGGAVRAACAVAPDGSLRAYIAGSYHDDNDAVELAERYSALPAADRLCLLMVARALYRSAGNRMRWPEAEQVITSE